MELSKHVKTAIVKLGEKGSLVYHDGEIVMVPCYPAKCIDTTGAGDSFAAGFLYGYTNGLSIEQSGKLGSLLASKVVEQKGVGLKGIDGKELKEEANKN